MARRFFGLRAYRRHRQAQQGLTEITREHGAGGRGRRVLGEEPLRLGGLVQRGEAAGVGDLGGASLELVELGANGVGRGQTFALGPLALGELACERDVAWRLPREIGVIAGSLPVGIGRAFSDLPQPNDGTVCVDETELPGATARIVLDTTHTGMLLSREVAEATVAFLRDGRFPHKGE